MAIIGFAVFSVLCLLIPQRSRLAILWIWGIWLVAACFPSVSATYLTLCGMGLLAGEILAGKIAWPSNLRKHRFIAPAVQVARIVVIVALCARYSFAIEQSKAEWRERAALTEKIPLHLMHLHPEFPEGTRLCFHELPYSVSNEEWRAAIQFRYPATQFSRVTVDNVAECVQEDKDRSTPIYVLRYHNNVLADVTRETLDESRVADVEDLSKRQGRILSKQNPDITLDLRRFPRCKSLGLVSALGNGIDILQGATVARGEIEGYNGQRENFELIAGQDTAEWAIRFPQVASLVKHQTPPVYRAWTSKNGVDVAQNYLKMLSFPQPIRPVTLKLELSDVVDGFDDLGIDVQRIICYNPPM
jgi:hypothetical protein